MATNQSRDVELNLRVQALGVESLQRLQQEVSDLAADGRIAADAGAALAQQIDRLLQSAGEFRNMAALEQAVNDLSLATERSRSNTLALAEDLATLSAKTANARATEEALAAELRTAEAAADALSNKRKALALNTDVAEQRTVEYRRAVQELKREEADANAVVEQRAQALRDAQAATAAANAAETSAASALNAATKEADANAGALSRRNAELRESRTALEGAGVAATDLATAERALIDANNQVRASVQAAEQAERDRIETLRAEALEEERLANIVFRTQQAMRDAAAAEAAGVVADFNKIQQAEQQAARQAQETSNTIRTAFSTLGTKSVAELRDEITRVRAAMETMGTTAGLTGKELDRAMSVGNQRIKELEGQIREATGSLTLMDQVSKALHSTVGTLAGGFVVLDIGRRLAAGFYEANSSLEKMRLGLNAVYKDSDLTGRQIEFLYQVANRAGVSITELQPAFLKFAASMQSANIPIKDTNALFSAVSQSAGVLGLSGDKLSHILDALSQMAGKGTVSMEELRQQLGDSLPGALSLAAKGLGVTDAELIKLVESGGLLARDLFPALTKSLESMGGEVNTLSSGWERFTNLLSLAATTIGDAGFLTVLKVGLQGIGIVIGPVLLGISTIIETITSGVRILATVISAIVNKDLKDLGPAVSQILDDALTRQSRLARAYQDLVTSSNDASDSQAGAARAIQQSGQAAGGAAVGVQANANAMQGAATAAQAGAAAQGQFATSTQQSGQAAASASPNMIRLGLNYADLAKQLTTNVTVSEALVKAREIEGKTLENLAKLTGDERTQLDAVVEARKNTLGALENELKARDAESSALVTYIGQLQQEVALHGDPGGVRAKDIQARQEKLMVLTAEAQKTREHVEQMRLEVAQAALTRKAYEDNAKSLDILKVVYENAKATLAAYIELQKAGFATDQQVTQAKLALSQAEGLYRDALTDSAAASDRLILSMQSQLALSKAQLTLDDARARSLGALAKSTGDSNLATQASIDLKENEIKRLNLSAAATRAEADEKLRSTEATRAALIATGSWTTAKEDEYQRLVMSTKARKLEADAMVESSKAIQSEINDIRNGVSARDGSTAAINRETQAIRDQIQAINDKYRTVGQDPTKTSDGFAKNKDGSAAGTFTNNLPLDMAFKLKDSGGKGMTPEEIAQGWQQAQNGFDYMQKMGKQNPGGQSFAFESSMTALYNGARTAFQATNAPTVGKPSGVTPTSTSGAAGGSTSHTVSITLNGSSQTINTATATDATALANLLKQLETASKSSV